MKELWSSRLAEMNSNVLKYREYLFIDWSLTVKVSRERELFAVFVYFWLSSPAFHLSCSRVLFSIGTGIQAVSKTDYPAGGVVLTFPAEGLCPVCIGSVLEGAIMLSLPHHTHTPWHWQSTKQLSLSFIFFLNCYCTPKSHLAFSNSTSMARITVLENLSWGLRGI